MAVKTYPVFGGGPVGSGQLNFPLVAPAPGAAGSEPFAFASGGGLHGTNAGGVVLSVAQGGDALALDNQGNATLQQTLSVVGLSTLTGGVTSPTGTLGTLTVQQNAQVGGSLGVTGSVQVTADLSARKITASSDLSAASVSTLGRIAGGSLTITGTATLGGLNVQGTFHAADIQSDGNFFFPTTSASAPGLALADDHQTGIFGAPGTLAVAIAGQTAVSFGSSLKANFAGDLAAQNGTFQALTTGNLSATGQTQLQSASAQSLAVAGALSAQGNTALGGDLTVQGATRLANLVIDQLSTDHDLAVGGNASVQGALSVGGNISGAAGSLQSLSVAVSAEIPKLTARVLLQPLTDKNNYSGVANLLNPDGVSSTAYSTYLEPNGNLSLSGALRVLMGATIGGALTSGNLTAGSGTFSGAGSFGGGGSFQGALTAASLAVTGALSAALSTIGGSTFQTCHGTPNGQVTGSVGDLVIDLDAGQAYLKQSGTSTNTGWVEVTTQANASGFPLLAPDGQPSAVPFSFASDGGTGMGRNAQNPLYLAVGGSIALSLGASGAATFAAAVAAQAGLTVQGTLAAAGALTVGTTLTVQGATQLTGLTAGTTQVGALTASQATVQGALSAQATSLAQLQVAGATTLAGALTVGGATQVAALSASAAIASQVSLSAPQLLAGGAVIQSGSGSPNGQVAGGVGDLYIERDTAALWQKTDTSANAGWLQVGGGGSLSFPLAAPLAANFAAPSYGFAGAQMGITDNGANVLVGVTSGQVGWSLDAQGNLSVRGTLAAAGLTSAGGVSAQGDITTQGAVSAQGNLSGAAISGASLQVTGGISAGGALSAGAATLAAITATSLTTTTGSVTSAQNVTAAGLVSGALVASNGSTWRAGSAAPASGVGQAGDLSSATGQDPPLWVRAQGGWKAVALVGDAAPANFPLRGPADSASAPNYSTQLAPNTGMYFPAANKIGWSTNGVSAGTVDANQNWSFVGALSAAAATFTGLTVNGAASVTGAVQLSSTLGVTGKVTLASDLAAANITASSSITAASATVNGTLGVQVVNTTGDVSIGGNLSVSGTTTYNGVNRAGYYQVGDGTVSSPAYAFTSEPGLGWWRSASGTLAAAAAGANLATLSASALSLAGALKVGGNNAGLTSTAANTLQVQTAGTAALSIDAGQNLAAAAKLSVVGLATFSGGATGPTATWTTSTTTPLSLFTETTAPTAGSAGQLFVKSSDHNLYFLSSAGVTTQITPVSTVYPLLANPDGSLTAPAYSWASETGLGWYRSAAGTMVAAAAGAPLLTLTASLATFSGALRVGGTNAGLTSPGANQLALQTAGTTALSFSASQVATFAAQAIHPSGTVGAPSVAVGTATTGVYAGTSQYFGAFVGFAQGGLPTAHFSQGTLTGGSTLYRMGLGDPASTLALGGLSAGTVNPVGVVGGLPGQVYQFSGGGAAQSLWVNESTTTTTAWVKVLTTSSTITPTYPLQSTTLGSASAPAYGFGGVSGYASTGMYAAAEQSTGNPVVVFASNSVSCGYFQGQTVNSKPVYNVFLGDPTAAVTGGASAGYRASAQTPVGTIGGYQGQIYSWLGGAAGTTLWVKESWNSSNTTTGWAYAFTSGMTQIAAQNGSVAAPYYSFSSSPSTGLTYASDAAFGSGAVPALVSQGKVCGYFGFNTANSLPIYNCILGDPTVTSSPYPAALRASAQAASGNLVGAVGQVAINTTGGAGTVLAVKEGSNGTSSGWSLVYTQGTAQLAGQNGTLAAPYHSFSGSTSSGLAYVGGFPVISCAGTQTLTFATGVAGISGYNGILFGAPNVDGVPYVFAVPSTAGNAGNPNTNAVPASRCALILNAAGAAGDQLWLHEPATSSAGWVRVLTESTQASLYNLKQVSSAPASASGVTKVYGDTNGQVLLSSPQNTAIGAGYNQVVRTDIPAFVLTQSFTLTIANSGETLSSSPTAQYTITLPATPAVDVRFRFQIETTQGIVIKAAAGQTIYLGANPSSVAGTLTSTTIGSTVEIFIRAGASGVYCYGALGKWTTA